MRRGHELTPKAFRDPARGDILRCGHRVAWQAYPDLERLREAFAFRPAAVKRGPVFTPTPGERQLKSLKSKVSIRDETQGDVGAIRDVTISAFNTLEISNHTEQFIVAALRAANALTVSLVAEVEGRVVGHVAFSPVVLSDGTENWYGLGPVSVLPEYQRRGIGGVLIEEGLARLKRLGARGCCLVGEPGYYGRFGFRSPRGLVHEGVPQEFFLVLSFDGHFPQGTVTFHDAFKADGEPGGGGDA